LATIGFGTPPAWEVPAGLPRPIAEPVPAVCGAVVRAEAAGEIGASTGIASPFVGDAAAGDAVGETEPGDAEE
jgi:hypothetical protein